MSIYTNGASGSNGPRGCGSAAAPPARGPVKILPVRIAGQNLAKARRTKQQRIALAEGLAAGNYKLARPTLKQAAALARVPVIEIYRARQKRKPGSMTPEMVAAELRAFSRSETVATARVLGADWVWDRMVAPLVGAAAE
jgi:hypothetical protein